MRIPCSVPSSLFFHLNVLDYPWSDFTTFTAIIKLIGRSSNLSCKSFLILKITFCSSLLFTLILKQLSISFVKNINQWIIHWWGYYFLQGQFQKSHPIPLNYGWDEYDSPVIMHAISNVVAKEPYAQISIWIFGGRHPYVVWNSFGTHFIKL